MSAAAPPPAEQRALCIAVYGDVDLNLLDGSAIWLASLVHVLARHPAVTVLVLLKAPESRDLITGALRDLPAVRLIAPQEVDAFTGGRLTPDQALDGIEELDRDRLDAVILRGFALCRAAAERTRLTERLWCYLTDIPQSAADLTGERLAELRRVAATSGHLLCQTEDLRTFLECHVPEARGKSLLLPPMIPPPAAVRPAGRDRRGEGLRIVYAGKFAPLWASREMLDLFRRFRTRHAHAELHVYGDKIHDPPDDPSFKTDVQAGLEETDGVVWHDGVPRQQLLADLPSMDLAWSWRLAGLDESLELSTKLLEYGAAGLPILLNRNPVNEGLLGVDYPLYAGTEAEVLEVLEALTEHPTLLRRAAERSERVSRPFTFDAVFERHVAPLLDRRLAVREVGRELAVSGPRTVLLAGHDFRFAERLRGFLVDLGLELLEDRWDNHDEHDEERSRALLARADVILCEWCLGNAVWYAENKRPDQRLVSRFHLQERETPFPTALPIEAVEKVIFVGPHIRDEALLRFGWPRQRVTVISNYVEDRQLEREKLPGAAFNLGMIGICPSRKRLDLALDVLEHLRAHDCRFVLYIKGKQPDEYPWLWARTTERDYYREVYERIATSPLLAGAVVFDPFGDDVPAWLRKIGWVLSVSDFESFHLAVAEGAASGAVPVVLPWCGADEIYPPDWVVASPRAAAERIAGVMEGGAWGELAAACRRVAVRDFGVDPILDQLASEVLGRKVGAAAARERRAERP